MKRWMALLVMALVAVASWALPTVDQVQAEVAKGNYAAAEVMMRDVIAERPKSARAHYVLAEILAHNGRLDDARQEAKRARELDPAIGFTARDKFEEFERALARGGRPAVQGVSPSRAADPSTAVVPHPAPPPAAARSSGVPGWLWGVGGAVIAVLLFRMLARRRAEAAAPMAGWAGQAGAGGMTGGMGGGMPGGTPGRSGLLGAGLAGAGGFAAGMLAERLLHGDRDSGSSSASSGGAALSDGGGDDEFSRRSVDFGSGSNDWGSDGGGSSSDGGGGGDW